MHNMISNSLSKTNLYNSEQVHTKTGLIMSLSRQFFHSSDDNALREVTGMSFFGHKIGEENTMGFTDGLANDDFGFGTGFEGWGSYSGPNSVFLNGVSYGTGWDLFGMFAANSYGRIGVDYVDGSEEVQNARDLVMPDSGLMDVSTGLDGVGQWPNHVDCLHEVKGVNSCPEDGYSHGIKNQKMCIDMLAAVIPDKIGYNSVSEIRHYQERNESNALDFDVEMDMYINYILNMPCDMTVALPTLDSQLHISDMVWGKVRTQRWCPGKIVDTSSAFEGVGENCSRDSYLISYYGSKKLAWNGAADLKPFRTHFSQMGKQSNAIGFRYAVNCALAEVSKRVEIGLSCSCMFGKLDANKKKSKKLKDACILKASSRREKADNDADAVSFEPLKLLKHMTNLAQSPCSEVNSLDQVTALGQMSAYNRWKGYPQLPKFRTFNGLEEISANDDIFPSDEHMTDVIPNLKMEEHTSSGKKDLVHMNTSRKKYGSISVILSNHSNAQEVENCSKRKSSTELISLCPPKRCRKSRRP